MNTSHSIVGELWAFDLDVRNGLPIITLQLRQRAHNYSSQHITCVRGYPAGALGLALAREHYAALRSGALYRVVADAIGVTDDGLVCLLGVQRFHVVDAWPSSITQRNSLADEAACQGLAMSLPPALRAAGLAP